MLHPKKSIAVIFFIILSTAMIGQTSDTAVAGEKKNILKLNLSALVFKNISMQYERKTGKRTSLSLNVHFIPFGKLPFNSLVEKIIDDPSVKVEDFRLGNFGFTPEFRYYVGKKGALHGFYLGGFVSFNQYKSDFPVNYSNDTRTGIFSGTLKSTTVGLQLGAQWKLGKSVYLDWWILGPNYGTASGDLSAITALSAEDQADLTNEIESLKQDLPLNVIKSYTVNANGATIVAKGPWAGLRGLGFNLGFRF
jgi:hypothetical protein